MSTKISGTDVYLGVLTHEMYDQLWQENEYDFENPTQDLSFCVSEEKRDKYFKELELIIADDHFIHLGVFKKDHSLIGDISLQFIDMKNRKATIGLTIAKKENRAQGYGKQATLLMLKYGFLYQGLERISANTQDNNIGAQKLLEQCGFLLEGRERHSIYYNGSYHDKLNYAILKKDYIKNNLKV